MTLPRAVYGMQAIRYEWSDDAVTGRGRIGGAIRHSDAMKASSPASSGPAGSHFEGQVGAHYLLTMLIGAEPRGLPGTKIECIEFQRGPEGHPLDDIVVHARDDGGGAAVLEIQAKRSLRFTKSSRRFRMLSAGLSRHRSSRISLAGGTNWPSRWGVRLSMSRVRSRMS